MDEYVIGERTIGRYPAPVVAAIGCGVQLAVPGLAAFLGEFHCTPLLYRFENKKINTKQKPAL